nr:hypothetical protein [Bacteroidota bacterium]
MELYLPPIQKRPKRYKITWTGEMISTLKREFPVEYNRTLAKKLGVSMRSLIRKAREFGIDKEPFFLEKRRAEITKMAMDAHPPHPHKGDPGWCIPNSEHTRFKPGQVSLMSVDPELVEKVRTKRNETIRKEKLRIKWGLEPKTKLNLINF